MNYHRFPTLGGQNKNPPSHAYQVLNLIFIQDVPFKYSISYEPELAVKGPTVSDCRRDRGMMYHYIQQVSLRASASEKPTWLERDINIINSWA